MGMVGPIDLGFPLIFREKQTGIGQAIKLYADGIGRLIKLFGKRTQVAGIGMCKKLQKKFDAGFGCNERVEQDFLIRNGKWGI